MKELSNKKLVETLHSLVKEERRISLQIIAFLDELDQRRLYAELGFNSLFTYLVQALGYCESAAQRRVQAVRALRDLPELKTPIEEGKLSISTVAQVQSYIRSQPKMKREERQELFTSMIGKSKREVEKVFATLSPELQKPDVTRPTSPTHFQIQFSADEALLEKLRRIQNLAAIRLKHSKLYNDLFHFMADLVLEKIDPAKDKRKYTRKEDRRLEKPSKSDPTKLSYISAGREMVAVSPPNSAPAIPSNTASTAPLEPNTSDNAKVLLPEKLASTRIIPPQVKRQVWKRDQGRCTHTFDNKRCESTYALEVDHVQPFALGGSSKDPDNLRLLCRQHNLARAIQTYGLEKLNRNVDRSSNYSPRQKEG